MAEKLSVLDQVKKLDAERTKIIGTARAEALRAAEDAVEVLNSLGFAYRLVEEQAAPRSRTPRAGGAGQKRQSRGGECPICHFETVPPHDGRAHRSQESKRPFTPAEMKEKGLAKAAD